MELPISKVGNFFSALAVAFLLLIPQFSHGEANGEQFLFRIDSATYAKVQALGDVKVEGLPIPVLFGVSIGEFGDSWGDLRSGGRLHKGTDIAAPKGEIIASPTDAVVTKVGYDDLGGHFVITANPGNEQFYYAHLDDIADELFEGDVLKRGDVIGYVGDTGNARGANHLHFEIYTEGQSINPFPRITREFTQKERMTALERMLDTGRIAKGAQNSGVRFLQQFLIEENIGPRAELLAEEGATGYFGNLTKFAIAEYQEERGISPAKGSFGPQTQGAVLAAINPNASVAQQVASGEPVARVASAVVENEEPATKPKARGSTSSTNIEDITTNMELGVQGPSVETLQEFLIEQGSGKVATRLAKEGVTGYFGPLTKDALVEYQKKVGVAPATGFFGALTRKAIRETL